VERLWTKYNTGRIICQQTKAGGNRRLKVIHATTATLFGYSSWNKYREYLTQSRKGAKEKQKQEKLFSVVAVLCALCGFA